jgi:hypothetical protein
MQQQISFCDILSEYGEDYISRNHIKGQQKGLIRLLSACRTDALGSHYQKCDSCNYLGKAYNSCRNRHCPLCQHKDKLQWLEKRINELLPAGYYHLVFTIPHELNPLCRQNKKVMYDLLFKAASKTVLELAKDTKHLGADTGLITVLHTWGQNMLEHPHLHCIMPAGGLSFDRVHWVHPPKKNDFFVFYKVLSGKFQGKFLDLLQKAYDKGQLVFTGNAADLAAKKRFGILKNKLYTMEWVVNIQAPFGSPEKVLEYLSRYVFRIAITNRRIIQVKHGKVLFTWKDYRSGRFRTMRLEVDEFIRRFLLHVLPKGFFKVRYYGIFASCHRKTAIQKSRELLEVEMQNHNIEQQQDGYLVYEKQNTVWEQIKYMIRDYQKPNCPQCKTGHLKFAGPVTLRLSPG